MRSGIKAIQNITKVTVVKSRLQPRNGCDSLCMAKIFNIDNNPAK